MNIVPFIVASAILLVIPGPAVIYITTRSIDQGRFAGMISVMGITIGTMFHITAAALGISALLAASVLAFKIVKYLGAIYLIYLGIRKFLSKKSIDKVEKSNDAKLRNIFFSGMIVEVLNPKAALFFFAFLPQFINPGQGSPTLQILLLGLIFVIMGVIVDGIYAMIAGILGHWLKQSRYFLKLQRHLSGSIYILLGIATAFSSFGKSK